MTPKKILFFALVFFLAAACVAKVAVEMRQKKLLHQGLRYFSEGQYEKAIANLEAFLKARPGILQVQTILMESYAQKRDFITADRLARGILEKDEQNAAAMVVRGEAFLVNRQWEDAQAAFRQASELLPNELAVARGMGFASLGRADKKKAAEWFDKAMKIKGDDPKTLLGYGLLLQAQGKGKEAMQYLKSASASLQNDLEAAARMADVYMAQNDFAQAQEVYRKLLESNPDSFEARVGIARIQEANGELQEAMDQYNQVLAKDADNTQAALELCRMYLDAGKLDEAFSLMDGLQGKHPNDTKIQCQYARVFIRRGEADRALDILKPVFEKKKNLVGAYLVRAEAYAWKGQTEEALADIKKVLELEPKNMDARFELGKTLILKGMNYEGIQELQKILQESPRYPHLHHYLGIGFLNGGTASVAVDELNMEVAAYPGNRDAAYHLALAYARAGKAEQAENAFSELLAGKPDQVDILYNLALVHAKSGKTKEAIEEFEKALTLKADDLPSIYNLAILYARSEQTDKAIELFKRVLDLEPDNLDARDNLAVLYERKGDDAAAIEQFQKILQVQGLESADVVWTNCAALYLKKKDIAQAREAAKKAIAANPKNAQAYYQMGLACEFNDAGAALGPGFDAAKCLENYRKALELDPTLKHALSRIDAVNREIALIPSKSQEAAVLAPASDMLAVRIKEFMTKGEIYFSQGQMTEAGMEWRKVLKVDPENTQARAALDKLAVLKAQDDAAIDRELMEQVDEDRNAKKENQKALRLAQLIKQAQAFCDAGSYDGAITRWQEALGLDPENSIVKAGLDNARKMKAQPAAPQPAAGEKPVPAPVATISEVEQKARQANIKEALSSGDLFMQIKDYSSAIEEYENVLSLDPSHAEAKEKIVQARMALGMNEQEARNVAPKKKTKEQKISSLLTNGEVQFKEGSFDQAIEVWNKVLQMEPSNSTARDKIMEAKDLKMSFDTRKKKDVDAREFIKQRALVRIKEAQLKGKKTITQADGGFRASQPVPEKTPKKRLCLAKNRDAFLDERFVEETQVSVTQE